MKKIPYNLVGILVLFFSISISAQKFDRKYNEEFKVNANVTINIDTRHTDIEVENWNKNEVAIEAIIIIEGASKKEKEEILENWKYKALGNKQEIEISSKSYGTFLNSIKFNNGEKLNFEPHSLNFNLSDISVENLKILDSFEVVMPDLMHFSEPHFMPLFENFHMAFDAPAFDYDAYTKDKDYMKKWQEKMKKNIEKMSIVYKEHSKEYAEKTAKLTKELKAKQEERKKKYVELQRKRAEVLERTTKARKEAAKLRKEVLEKRHEEMTKNRKIMKNILADREKIKIKRIIRIKAPKDAKFNMNVKYGTISFPN